MSPVFASPHPPTHSEECHASDIYKRKLDYEKGFNYDWTVTDAGGRIAEMTEKSKISMEDPWQKLQRKLKKKSETSTADKVQKDAHDVKTMTKDTMDSIEVRLYRPLCSDLCGHEL